MATLTAPDSVLREIANRPGTILSMYRGSMTHGTYRPPAGGGIDDVDTMSVVVAPASCYHGLDEWGSRGTREERLRRDGLPLVDHVAYEVRKFVRLLLQNNPNVLGMLWLKPKHYLARNGWGQNLILNRDCFASRRAYHSFTGYAYSQLSKLQSPSTGYMGARRREMFRELGFDAKNASHLIRLLRMGCEFIETGEMRVDRTDIDADHLVAIKRGEVSLSKIEAEADEGFARARDALETSPLPEKPNREKANEITCEIVRETLRGG